MTARFTMGLDGAGAGAWWYYYHLRSDYRIPGLVWLSSMNRIASTSSTPGAR